ncbi:cation:proton antiporter [Pseudomonas zhanjiangensis]|uniref:Cation:proton antiporter n=1 Tax=Pseudomonas zhanjiangensis TaxID=3239015 RepID=A0ABV3YQL3_9PSED
MLELAAAFICLTTLMTYISYRFTNLPPAIGVMATALIFSLLLQGVTLAGYPVLEQQVGEMLQRMHFQSLLMDWMLSFLLFAGALHVKLDDLHSYKWPIGLLATLGVLLSTLMIAGLAYWTLALFGWQVNGLYCLLFGALISPTDPIAVLGILRSAGAPKPLETTIVGESLFNDGVAVVVFTVLLTVALQGQAPSALGVAELFATEALGGIVLGLLLGYGVYLMMRSIDQYQVEVMLSLALVIGGSALAAGAHVSAPIAMVVAGLIIGNLGRHQGMSEQTRRYVDKFWELIDEMLNAFLFALMGLEILLLPFSWLLVAAGVLMGLLVLGARVVTIAPAVLLLRRRPNGVAAIPKGAIRILSWGGLRGGISVALALSLPAGAERDLLLSITYIIVLGSILIQGLSIGPLVRRIYPAGGRQAAADH